MRDGLRMVGNAVIVLILIAVGEAIPPLKALERWMWLHRPLLVAVTGGAALFGLFFLIGGAVFRMVNDGAPLSRGEVEAHVKRVKDAQAMPYTFRVSRVFLPKQSAGSGFSDTGSIDEFVQAWRTGLWRRDPRWSGIFLMASGAALMAFGVFGTVGVLGSAGIKFLVLLAAAYVAYRFARGPTGKTGNKTR